MFCFWGLKIIVKAIGLEYAWRYTLKLKSSMDPGFVFVNPNKIPPRRSVRKTSSSGPLRANKISSGLPERNRKAAVFIKKNEPDETPEFDFLSDSAYSAGENATPLPDSLTRAMLGEVPLVEPDTSVNLASLSDESPPSPIDPRAALLDELESIDRNDAELLRQIYRISKPSRISPLTFASSRMDSSGTKDSLNLKVNVFKKPSSLGDDVKSDYYRAENDWFQVNLAVPERIDKIKKYARDRAREGMADNTNSEESGPRFKTFLAVLVLFFVPAAVIFFLYSGENNFLKSALAGLNSKLLSSSSFTLVNREENTVFPKLSEIRSQIKHLGASDSAAEAIFDFLEKNTDFDWFNIFKKNTSDSGFTLAGLDFLDKAKNIVLASTATEVKDLNLRLLDEQIIWFEFWNRVFLPEKKYLVVITDEKQPWPGAGKPQSYVVVKTTASGLDVVNSANVGNLDAAFNLKIIPPEPVRVASTAWLPSESFWFLDFEDSIKTFINFFENTTGTKIDGAMVFSRSFLKELSFKENLVFNIDSPNWFYGLTDTLSRKPAGRWLSLAQTMEKGLYSHKVQFYFKDDFLKRFVLNSGWSNSVRVSPQEDFLGMGWTSVKDGSLGLDLMEYRSSIFEDGSVMARINILLRQDNNGVGSQNYFKIYLPQGSQPLKAEGFSPREKIPEFEYARQGFSTDVRIKPPEKSEIENLDVFEESGLTVAGGWVNLKSADRNTLSLEYLLPFKLARKNTLADYHLKVTRPHQNEDVPFRFIMTPEKGIKLMSLDPNGFVSGNLGEYQGNLSSDLILDAGLAFEE